VKLIIDVMKVNGGRMRLPMVVTDSKEMTYLLRQVAELIEDGSMKSDFLKLQEEYGLDNFDNIEIYAHVDIG
jgi:hypothetical protein